MCILIVAHSDAGWLLPVLFQRYSPETLRAEFLTRAQGENAVSFDEIERRSEHAQTLVLGLSRQSLVEGNIARAETHAIEIFLRQRRPVGVISLEASCLEAPYLQRAAPSVRAIATMDFPSDTGVRFPNAHFVHLHHVPDNELRGYGVCDKTTRCEWIARNLHTFTQQLLAA